ncbi:hypothetical protein ABZ800_35825 [Streptomyces sp. NPDC047813]|uniref:hypothetical protein n=1 Tax=Streptomyces sp. NPDC047813 TaxID=3154608 RepID=UPI0033D2AA04
MSKNRDDHNEVSDEDERSEARQARWARGVGDYGSSPALEELAAHERAVDRIERLRQNRLED